MENLVDSFFISCWYTNKTLCIIFVGQEHGLPEYVVSECYGDIFNFDCGPGNKIRINRDFFGYSSKEGCRYRRGDCIISNPKSNSLIHRFCTGQRVCTYYMVERRGCGGYFSNYQQVEYQCIPGEIQFGLLLIQLVLCGPDFFHLKILQSHMITKVW